MHKRGISPLIASVLLIAFTVTLFLIISTWVQRSVVEPGLEESGEKISKTLDCLSAKLNIDTACKSADNPPIKIKITVDNEGDVEVKDLQVRVVGSTGVQTFNAAKALQPLERYNSGDKPVTQTGDGAVGTITSIEVYPVLDSGICRSNPATKTQLGTC